MKILASANSLCYKTCLLGSLTGMASTLQTVPCPHVAAMQTGSLQGSDATAMCKKSWLHNAITARAVSCEMSRQRTDRQVIGDGVAGDWGSAEAGAAGDEGQTDS